MDTPIILYRYDFMHVNNQYGFPYGHLICYEFEVIKETPCGYWIRDYIPNDNKLHRTGRLNGDKKWINKIADIKWATTDKKRALDLYVWRKKYQLKMIKHQLNSVQYAERLGVIEQEKYKNKEE